MKKTFILLIIISVLINTNVYAHGSENGESSHIGCDSQNTAKNADFNHDKMQEMMNEDGSKHDNMHRSMHGNWFRTMMSKWFN